MFDDKERQHERSELAFHRRSRSVRSDLTRLASKDFHIHPLGFHGRR